MQLFALCLNPLIHTLEEALTGIRLGRGSARVAAVAYADDVSVFLTSTADVQKIKVALRTYEEATGAKIKVQKSQALAIGGWDTLNKIMDIPYNTGIKIVGFHFTDSVNVANKENWRNVTSLVRALAQDTYYRDLSLDKRIRFGHDFLLARIWYVAQLFPLTSDSMRQINTAITWFVWCGEIFRVPHSTFQRGRDAGGWDLVNIWAKSRALFIYRLQVQGRHERSFTGAWLKRWNIIQEQTILHTSN